MSAGGGDWSHNLVLLKVSYDAIRNKKIQKKQHRLENTRSAPKPHQSSIQIEWQNHGDDYLTLSTSRIPRTSRQLVDYQGEGQFRGDTR